ncbi:MAG: response regulator [Cyanobacteria bacterium P01_E01_bin.42]
MTTGNTQTVMEKVMGADNKTHDFQTIKTPILGTDSQNPRVLGVATDISDLKAAGLALQESEAKNRAILAAARESLETDGYEMMREIRQREDLKNIKIIVSSASVSQGDRQTSLEAGGDDFLSKPIVAEMLFALLERHLPIEWERESEGDPGREKEKESIANTELVAPPAEELRSLYNAAAIGDIRGIEGEAERIQQLDPRYGAFASKLLHLAREMDEEAILILVKQSIS